MPKVDYVERTIYSFEGVQVIFMNNGKDLRGDASLPCNYSASRMTKNAMNIAGFKEKLKKQFPGYDFKVLKADGSSASGQTLLGTVRDTYL